MQITPAGTGPASITQNTQTQSFQNASPQPQPQPPTPPIPGPEPKVEPAANPDAARFAAIAKKEKALRQQQRMLQQQRAQLEQQMKPWQEASETAKQSKLEAIKKLGFSYDELTQEALNQEAPTPEYLAERAAQRIVEQKMAEMQKQQAAQQAQEYEKALIQIQSEAKQIVTASEDFPVLKETGNYEAVSEYMKLIFDQEKRIIPVSEAVKHMEEFLEEEALKIASIAKIRSKLVEQSTPQPQASSTAPNTQKPQTLTHKLTTAAAASPTSLTPEERRKRAIDIFYGSGG